MKKPPYDLQNLNTLVFIDYEYLFISSQKVFRTTPMLGDLLNDLKTCGKILNIKVFADFTDNPLSQERNKIRTITNDIIDCASEAKNPRKDFTDFIMLDHIYREIIQNKTAEQFIFITGDGHFSSAATFLRITMDKTVGVYGITGTFSQQLNECVTWSKFIEVVDDDLEVYAINLIKNFKAAESSNIICTFLKTVEHVQRIYGGEDTKYRDVLNNLIMDGFISTEICTAYADKPFKMLVPQWDKINGELLPFLNDK